MAEAEYVTGNIGAKALARKLEISYYTLRTHAEKGHWYTKRQEHQRDVMADACRKARTDSADKLANMLRASDGLSEIIARTVDKLEALDRQTAEHPIDIKMIRDLTMATKELTAVIRDLYNLPSDGEELARRIAMERLSLEKERAPSTDDREIKVILTNGAESYAD